MPDLRSFSSFLLSLMLASACTAETLKGDIIDLEPWGYKNIQGEIVGRQVDYLHKLSAKTGITFEYELRPLKRISSELINGNTDFSMLFSRESYRAAVEQIAVVEDLSLYLLSQNKPLGENSTVGVILGQEEFLIPYFQQLNQPLPKFVTVKNNEQLFMLMKFNRINGLLTSQSALDSYIQKNSDQQPFYSEKTLVQEKKVYFFFAINSPHYSSELKDKIAKGISEITAEQTKVVTAP